MLIGSATQEGSQKPLVVIGLCEENLVRLRAGKPITTDKEVHANLACDFVIYYGETMGELRALAEPMISEATQVNVVDARKQP